MVALPSNLPPRVVDERRSTRTRTLLAGKVVYGDGRSYDCTIRDISQMGARITLANGQTIPTHVFLIDRRAAIAYEARVSWIKAPHFGLAFGTAYNLETELPSQLKYLSRIWSLFRSPLSGHPV